LQKPGNFSRLSSVGLKMADGKEEKNFGKVRYRTSSLPKNRSGSGEVISAGTFQKRWPATDPPQQFLPVGGVLTVLILWPRWSASGFIKVKTTTKSKTQRLQLLKRRG
jgi:hypothetical protein